MVKVSIVMPLFNDAEWVADALESCMKQTSADIEVVCVDDASTDQTTEIVESKSLVDSRVRLIRLTENRSAFQARRVGVQHALGKRVLFLDGDDTLSSNAAQITSDLADSTGADVVGFGVEVITDDGSPAPRFERTLQPAFTELQAPDIISSLFPVGVPAQGHIWKYLFDVELLRSAYEGVPDDLRFYRANDIPISFLSLSMAQKYVSTKERLYHYSFRRGTSGQRVSKIEDFQFYLSAIDSIESISERVGSLAENSTDSLSLAYASARLSIVGNIIQYCVKNADSRVRLDCIELLEERVGLTDTIRAAAAFCPESLSIIADSLRHMDSPTAFGKNVLVTTGNLRTGGVQGVVAAQCAYLVAAGFRVTLALFSSSAVMYDLPEEVEVVRVPAGSLGERVDHWLHILRSRSIGCVIDHHIFYNDYWPYFVTAARSINVPTIGWLHNFCLRPMMDLTSRTTFLVNYLPLMMNVVVLSKTDVAFWKLRGIKNVCFLPNPPSPLLMSIPVGQMQAKSMVPGILRLVWWGRLQQSTKQVRELIKVAAGLRRAGVDFSLTIVGPDGKDLSSEVLRRDAVAAGVGDAVVLPGPLHGSALLGVLSGADILVSTSIIEGYPLALLEAQALGLPIFMYELPWLAILEGNEGIVSVPQGRVSDLVDKLSSVADSPAFFRALSEGSLAASDRSLDANFSDLYVRLLGGKLPSDYSPEPVLADSELLLEWAGVYAERNARISARVVRRYEASISKVRRENQKLRRSESLAKRRVRSIRGSWSFRIGRCLTQVPRTIRGWLARIQQSRSA